jgi:hypothetical protein
MSFYGGQSEQQDEERKHHVQGRPDERHVLVSCADVCSASQQHEFGENRCLDDPHTPGRVADTGILHGGPASVQHCLGYCRKSIYGYGWKKQARSAFLAVVHGLPLVASMPGSHSALFLPFASAERSDTTT